MNIVQTCSGDRTGLAIVRQSKKASANNFDLEHSLKNAVEITSTSEVENSLGSIAISEGFHGKRTGRKIKCLNGFLFK